MGCFSGCLMSSASDQKLFCKLCSPFCCSFDDFVEEKVISPSYSSAILTPPPAHSFSIELPSSSVPRYSSKEENLLFSQKINPESIKNFPSELVILGVIMKPSSGQWKMRAWLGTFQNELFQKKFLSQSSSGRGGLFSGRHCFIHMWSLELCGSHFVTMRRANPE